VVVGIDDDRRERHVAFHHQPLTEVVAEHVHGGPGIAPDMTGLRPGVGDGYAEGVVDDGVDDVGGVGHAVGLDGEQHAPVTGAGECECCGEIQGWYSSFGRILSVTRRSAPAIPSLPSRAWTDSRWTTPFPSCAAPSTRPRRRSWSPLRA